MPRKKPLHPGELAHAAVMAALCSAIAVSAVALPFGAGLAVLSTVPMALVAYRHRFRALGAATVAGIVLSFLVVGMGGLFVVFIGAYLGGLVGIMKRRGQGNVTAFAAALVAGSLFAVGGVGLLMVLSRLRDLVFDNIRAYVDGVANIISIVPLFSSIGRGMSSLVATFEAHWMVFVATSTLLLSTFVSMVGWWALSRMLKRLGGVPDVHKLDAVADDRLVAPVPVEFHDVCVRYPGCDQDAVGPLDLTVVPGEHLAVTGANGSGKTTLMLLLAGRTPTSGTVVRPGAVGLGQHGGTAVVMQHPESQVLGTRVVDDVVWGLPPGVTTDVDRLLAEVGLGGLGERDTSGLSGGELQRLAVAAALAREPRLLIADEITSMVDQNGRDTVIDMLSGLTQDHDMALVHITHYDDEARTADRVLNLTGDDNLDMVVTTPRPQTGPAPVVHSGAKLLELNGVGHEYGSGTPWASTALRDIDLVIGEGDGVLIHGLNGSGKSTLAWVMAGLLEPTTGSCLLDGRPMSEQVGSVALSFQAARLQMMRGRVGHRDRVRGRVRPRRHARVEEVLASRRPRSRARTAAGR
ncbi:ATP-binding cassette domain-containing protein, partial [Lentzea indica]|uniref:ATP-binding cassette domain-containing protein n=1 Tax=Lentzea indica TaxID=2604800 RepID=UPI001CB6C1A6